MMEEYIAHMEQNGFTLVDKYVMKSFINSYVSYGLICDEATEIPTKGQMYSKTDCHVSIRKDGSKWRVDVCDGINLCDMGVRRDGDTVSALPKGESLGAGVKGKPGKYKTTDKRFSVKSGQADVLLNGQRITAQASWKGINNIKINVDITDRLSAEIEYEKDKISQGDIYQLCSVEERPVYFKLINGDNDIGISQEGALHYYNAVARIMALGDDNNVAIYLYAEPMDTENYPQTFELLCAVNTTGEKTDGGGLIVGNDREPFRPDHSRLDCLSCNGSGDCDECGGALYVYYGGNRAKCGTCKGTGDCRTCGGSGKRQIKKQK